MFVSGCALLSGKALVSGKKPSQDQRERERERPNQVSPRPTGRRQGGEWGERHEGRGERAIETERKKKKKRESRPGVAQTAGEEKEVSEVAFKGGNNKTMTCTHD